MNPPVFSQETHCIFSPVDKPSESLGYTVHGLGFSSPAEGKQLGPGLPESPVCVITSGAHTPACPLLQPPAFQESFYRALLQIYLHPPHPHTARSHFPNFPHPARMGSKFLTILIVFEIVIRAGAPAAFRRVPQVLELQEVSPFAPEAQKGRRKSPGQGHQTLGAAG